MRLQGSKRQFALPRHSEVMAPDLPRWEKNSYRLVQSRIGDGVAYYLDDLAIMNRYCCAYPALGPKYDLTLAEILS